MEIHTQRLLLRPVRESDAQDVFDYASLPDVGPNAGWKPHETIRESRRVIRDIFMMWDGILGIVVKDENKLIGTIGLVPDPRRNIPGVKMLGYAIGTPWWGKGIMTEATRALLGHGFTVQGLQLISAYTYPFNERSRHVLEKCGFSYEGELRQAERLYSGIVLSNLCYSITAGEYEELTKE